jgi:hypothetical protein
LAAKSEFAAVKAELIKQLPTVNAEELPRTESGETPKKKKAKAKKNSK